MTMSRWRACPRVGHLDRVKRIYGYLAKFEAGYSRVETAEPDLLHLPDPAYDWDESVYGKVREELPEDAPEPLGKPVVLTTYVDANLHHDLVTGRLLTAVIHFINGTYFDYYTKRQATVECATFSTEFVAARTAVEQIIDNRLTLRYFGVEIKGSTKMFGDNKSVVINSSVPHSQLKKRHVALAYHKTREAIAAKIVDFYHIDGKKNYADILSKHWGHYQVWPLLKDLLFKDQGNKTGNEKRKIMMANLHARGFGELQHSGTDLCNEEALYSLSLVFPDSEDYGEGYNEGLYAEGSHQEVEDLKDIGSGASVADMEEIRLDDNCDLGSHLAPVHVLMERE